jgi:hypothetical protein
MNDWNMLIQDSLDNSKAIQNPKFIPRKGDNINMGYTPWPEVLKVIIDYEKKIIAVKCS